MKKNPASIHLGHISRYFVFRFLHWITILYYVSLFSYETLFVKNTDLVYAIALSAIAPYIIYRLKFVKIEEGTSPLPYLSSKVHYSSSKLFYYNTCYLADTFLLLALQLRNTLSPYDYFWLQYSPVFLLAIRIISAMVFTYIVQFILHQRLMQNKI